LLGHIKLTNYQYNLPPIEGNTQCKKNRAELPEHFPEGSVRRSVEADLALIDGYDREIRELEKYILKEAKEICPEDLELLQSIPGVGKILSLTFVYECQTIERFGRVQDFVSYCRAVKSEKTSAGKSYGTTGGKMGNEYLKWALSELVIFSVAHSAEMKAFYSKLERKHEPGKAKAIVRAKLARVIYFMLKRREKFDVTRFK
jgi:transposase